MRKKLGQRSRIVGLLTVSAAALAAIFVFAGPSAATTGGSLDWNGVNGATACAPDTTGTMLWIFNPHSDAVPTDLTITWNLSGGGTVTQTYTGWENPGGGQNWHLTVDIPAGAVLPPVSATLDYTGALGSNPILTISGCNEGGGGSPPAAAPTVSKTAGQNANTEFGWTIGKAVDKSEIDTTPGTTATFHYTVTLTGSAGTPTIGDVTGTITVFNNAGGDINLATLTDQLSDGTDCTVDTSADPTLLIPANSSQDFPYSCGLSAYPTDYPNTTNTVSMTWNAQDLSDGSHLDAGSGGDSVPVDFTTSVTDNCATATDTFNGGAADALGTYCADDPGNPDLTGVTLDNFAQSYTAPTWTITYSRTVPAPATLGSCQKYDNEADFADNSEPQHTGSKSASATVCAFNAPLTIGYWKTHMSLCGPHVKTGTNGCNNNGPFTSQFLGQTICNGTCVVGKLSSLYSADTTTKALAVFNANNCANAGTSNSNAAACLAAQLLGAELNVANIANPCICDTINQAIDFLTHVGYNGPGSAVTFDATYTRAGAIALKTALDNYNNGLGCP
jgi:hypothetical protein